MPYQPLSGGIGYQPLSAGRPEPMTPQERLRAFQERYPGAMPGLDPNVAPGEPPAVERQGFFGRFGDYGEARRRSFLDTLQSSLWDVTRIPETGVELGLAASKALLPKPLERIPEAVAGVERRAIDAITPEFIERGRERSAREAAASKQAKAEAWERLGISTGARLPSVPGLRNLEGLDPADLLSVGENFGEDFTSMALDPLELLPGGMAFSGARALQRGRRAGGGASRLDDALRAGGVLDELSPTPRSGDLWYDPASGKSYSVLDTGEDSLRVQWQEDGRVDEIFESEGRPHRLLEPATQPVEAPPAHKSSEAGFIRIGKDAPPPTPEQAAINEFDEKYFDRKPVETLIRDRVVELGRRVRFELEDEYQPILRMVRQAGDPARTQLAEELIQQVRGAPVRAEIPVLRRTIRFDPVTMEEIVPGPGVNDFSLMEAMGGLPEEKLLDAERLMAAERNLGLADRAAAGEALSVTEESVAESKTLLASLRTKYGAQIGEIEEAASRYRDWSRRAFLEPLLDTGVLGAQGFMAMLAKGDDYAHFRRVGRMLDELGIDTEALEVAKRVSGGGGGPRAGSPIKRIHSGLSEEDKLTGIWESSALQAMRVQRFVDRQHVKNLLGHLADKFPDEVPIRKLDKVSRPVTGVENAAGEVETIWRRGETGSPKAFVRYVDGERIEYEAPSDVLDALGRLSPPQAIAVLGPARFATRALRAGAVDNPAFATFNALRDIQLAPIYTRGGMIPGYDVLRATGNELLSRARGEGPTEAWTAALEASGFSTIHDIDRQAARTLTRDAQRFATPGGWAKTFLREWKSNPLLPLQVVSSLVERLPRLAEADLLLRGGRRTIAGLPIPGTLGKAGKKVSKRTAGTAASEVTLNFSKGGRVGKSWNRYEAFANAALLDVGKFMREMRQRPFETTVRSLVYIGIPSAINYALNKDDPEYQEIPEWEKALFYHPGKAPNGWWIRIPRPLGLPSVVFGYGLEKSLEALNEDDPEQAARVLEGLSATTLLGYATQPMDFLPNVAQPLVEAHPKVNYSAFRDRPVVPEGRENWPAPEQVGPYTSPTMAALGEKTGLSPERLEYVWGGHTATLGREVLSLVDQGILAPSGRSDKVSSPKDVPILGRFYSNAGRGFNSVAVESFYRYADKTEGARSLLSNAPERGTRYPEAALSGAFDRGRKVLGKLSDAIAQVRVSDLPDAEKRKQIEDLERQVTAIARQYVNLYEDEMKKIQAASP